ncbi:MAG: hypothetical protein LBG44_00090 [Gemmatimonadota bacterium]|jgi:hypothetical protein|nr:hypothetical protein [Gemmatimonadota bacterium]
MAGITRLICLGTLSLAVVACGSAGGFPANSVAVATPLSLEGPSIYSLLGFRNDLKLTSEQVVSLDSIAIAIREENRDLIAELREVDGKGNSIGQPIVVTEEGRPILEAIRENHRGAVAAVRELLDETQRNQVCDIVARPGQARGRSGRPAGPENRAPDGGAPRGEARDSLDERSRLSRPVSWDWCEDRGTERRES